MTVSRGIFAFGLFVALAGCGPAIPPAGNYAVVTGRITDAQSGAGVAGAVVSVNVVLSATSDASGSYRITNVPTGPWSYAVAPPSGFVAPPGNDQSPPLGPGETRSLNITLNHG